MNSFGFRLHRVWLSMTFVALLAVPGSIAAQPASWGPMSPSMEDVPYPHPV